MNREQFDHLARHKIGAPKPMSDAALQRGYFVAGPHNAQLPPKQWPKSKNRSQFGAKGLLTPREKVPCANKVCDGSGQRLIKFNPSTNTKTYVLCACRGGGS